MRVEKCRPFLIFSLLFFPNGRRYRDRRQTQKWMATATGKVKTWSQGDIHMTEWQENILSKMKIRNEGERSHTAHTWYNSEITPKESVVAKFRNKNKSKPRQRQSKWKKVFFPCSFVVFPSSETKRKATIVTGTYTYTPNECYQLLNLD